MLLAQTHMQKLERANQVDGHPVLEAEVPQETREGL